jgi:hypothetical protein
MKRIILLTIGVLLVAPLVIMLSIALIFLLVYPWFLPVSQSLLTRIAEVLFVSSVIGAAIIGVNS